MIRYNLVLLSPALQESYLKTLYVLDCKLGCFQLCRVYQLCDQVFFIWVTGVTNTSEPSQGRSKFTTKMDVVFTPDH